VFTAALSGDSVVGDDVRGRFAVERFGEKPWSMTFL
jgi:hypothetical protein